MTDQLLTKLQNVLSKRITNEAKVVYLLVEVRKLMEREHYSDALLKTFCNWVVHTSLENRAEGSAFVLGEFDQWFIELYDHKRKSDRLEHISLGAFRLALNRFFDHFHLTASVGRDREEWKKFCSLYCSIVSECPITFTASRAELRYVKQVELTRITPGILVKEWPIVNWRISFHGGTEHDWGFHVS